MRVVVITDRRIADPRAALPALLAAVPRGAVGVQVREKDLDGGALLALVREVVAIADGASVWVNDRLDVALAAGAAGVHLPERGLAIADARALASIRIGCSRHTRDAVLAASDADLVQLGPIWDVPGKGPAIGEAALAVRRELPARVQLVAVGGIDTPARARAAAAAGADAVAVIRAAWAAWGDGGPARIAELVGAVELGLAERVSR